MSRADRVRARAVSGPVGRTLAFAGDLGAVLWRVIRRTPADRPLGR